MTVRQYLKTASDDEVCGFWLNVFATAYFDYAGKELSKRNAIRFFFATKEYLKDDISRETVRAAQHTGMTNKMALMFLNHIAEEAEDGEDDE